MLTLAVPQRANSPLLHPQTLLREAAAVKAYDDAKEEMERRRREGDGRAANDNRSQGTIRSIAEKKTTIVLNAL